MKFRRIILVFSTLLLIAIFVSGYVYASEKSQPNILVVLIDDMGWSDLACFGNRQATTPNIDRLAAEGISFSQFYVCAPICSPSRCGLTTGQYPYRWRINSYLDNRKRNQERGIAQWLDPSAPSLARFLKANGYATGHFGKWHLGGQRDVSEAPLITRYGFDETLTNFEGLGPRVLPLLNVFDGAEPKKYSLGSDLLGHGEIHWIDRNQVTSCYAAKALEFIQQAEQNEKPFYVNLWTDDVHTPLFPAAELRGDGKNRTLYYGVLQELDQQLAPLLDYIRCSETLRNNTLIVLFSDNGPAPGVGSATPLRGRKGSLYEGGIRSPLIVWGDGFVDSELKGTRNNDAAFFSLDLVPSLLKITGTPPDSDIVFDGEDFSDVLLGKIKNQERNQPMFWRKPPGLTDPPNHAMPDLAMRKGNWKFVMQYDGTAPELYDLNKNSPESNNLAESHPDLVEQFREELHQWSESMPKDIEEKTP
ncbi:MAG: sulfatase-like hydrolase/transferase [Planctomycetaceae bacterium]|jgi:uncharacterized sulfatase|nr:sulfatase-like hydrolase/transferase [Planctomycetaceae bacterium]